MLICGALTVNLGKSKVMIFRKGVDSQKIWKWQFKGQRVEIVNTYKILRNFNIVLLVQ